MEECHRELILLHRNLFGDNSEGKSKVSPSIPRRYTGGAEIEFQSFLNLAIERD